ncbi:glycoside hydrolase [Candidatus Parcubacteria bacterium]|nr:glycoside hydrolase [Candidatus Parcubacteria bacterium]
MNENIIDQCYKKSIELLKKNSTEYGILACSPSKVAEKKNYLSVFGRDASICSLGIVSLGNKELIKSTKAGLEILVKYQGINGQIPTYVKPIKKQSSFWYLTSLDSTLWWLIAVKNFDDKVKSNFKFSKKYKKEIKKAIFFLQAHENPPFCLIEHNEAADWADIMPRSAYVLNANALWFKVKELYKLDGAEKTKENFNYLFDQTIKVSSKIKKENSRLARVISHVNRKKNFNYYLSFVNYAQYPENEDIDIFGNLLAVIFNLGSKVNQKKFLQYAIENKIDEQLSVKVSLKPITKKSVFWREYMKRHNQNLPNKYHNGGIWPFVGGFWVIALHKAGMKTEAKNALEKLAQTNEKGNWAFNEWFHGKNKRAMGKRGQSWNAGMYIYAYDIINNKVSKI